MKATTLNTQTILMKKCSDRNETKKSPESAIATFFAIDDFNNVDFAIRILKFNFEKSTKINQFEFNYNHFVLIYIDYKC